MPTYSYACTACEHRFDTVQTFTDRSLTDCPECAGRLRKLFSSVGIVFKGSGFYRTDSRASPPSESGSADKSKAESTSGSTAESTAGATSKAASGDSAATPASAKSGAASSSTTSSSASTTSS